MSRVHRGGIIGNYEKMQSCRRKKRELLVGEFIRMDLSCNEIMSIRQSAGCSFAYAVLQTQCTGMVRIIAPS